MSAISPLIRMLRAEADALENGILSADPSVHAAIGIVIVAKRGAADQLEAEERELTERIDGR